MTPKEKGQELVVDYYSVHGETIYDGITWGMAKQCALIAVDEIIEASPSLPILSDAGNYADDIIENKVYWQEVKQEIEKL